MVACDAPPAASGGAAAPAVRATRRVMVIDAEAYHAGTLVAAMDAIEAGVPVLVDSRGTPQGRVAVRQVQQLLLKGAAIDADAVEITRSPGGDPTLKAVPAGASRVAAPLP